MTRLFPDSSFQLIRMWNWLRRSHSVTSTTATARVMVPLPISSSSLYARAVLTPSSGPGGSQDERAGAVARSRTVGLRHPDYRGRTPRPPADLSSSSFLLLSESLSFFVSRFVQGFFQIANSWWRNSGPQCTPKYGFSEIDTWNFWNWQTCVGFLSLPV